MKKAKAWFLSFALLGSIQTVACSPDRLTEATQTAMRSVERTSNVLDSRLGFDITGIPDDPAVRDSLLALASNANFQYVRFVISWADQQPNNHGEFDEGWRNLTDGLVASIGAHGLTPVVGIVQTPCWAHNGVRDGEVCTVNGTVLDNWRIKPPHPAFWWHYQAFVDSLVERYPTVNHWAIGNEPNAGYYSPDYGSEKCAGGYWLDAYYLAFLYAADVIQARSGKVTLAPELGDAHFDCNGDTTETSDSSLYKFASLAGGRMRTPDVFTAHSYGPIATEFAPDLHNWDAALNHAGKSNNLWVTEVAHSKYMEGEWPRDNGDYWQAYVTTGFFTGLDRARDRFPTDSFSYPSRLKKLFKHHLINERHFSDQGQGYYGVINVEWGGLPLRIERRYAYDCLKAYARREPLGYYCNHQP